MKLVKVYEYLKMYGQVTPILMDEYQYICLNKFYFKNGKPSYYSRANQPDTQTHLQSHPDQC